jgi:hypothetical protein
MKKLTAAVLLFVSISLCALSLPGASAASTQPNPQQKARSSSSNNAAQPIYAIAPDDPEATFQGARVVHNVVVDGEKGMRIHAKFTVKYGYDVRCRMIAYFYYADGNKLKSADKNYSTSEGQVSARVYFTPKYDPAVYNDLQLFVPYEALNMEAGEEYDLKFYLSLYDNEGERFFGKSGWYNFHLTMPEE